MCLEKVTENISDNCSANILGWVYFWLSCRFKVSAEMAHHRRCFHNFLKNVSNSYCAGVHPSIFDAKRELSWKSPSNYMTILKVYIENSEAVCTLFSGACSKGKTFCYQNYFMLLCTNYYLMGSIDLLLLQLPNIKKPCFLYFIIENLYVAVCWLASKAIATQRDFRKISLLKWSEFRRINWFLFLLKSPENDFVISSRGIEVT